MARPTAGKSPQRPTVPGLGRLRPPTHTWPAKFAILRCQSRPSPRGGLRGYIPPHARAASTPLEYPLSTRPAPRT